jgi:putative transposase
VKGKYFYLRKSLSKSKNLELIRKIKHKEKNKANSILHKVSRVIVNNAAKNKAAIVIGRLKNLKKNKGRKFNRKIGSFSYYKLVNYISYKAKVLGVPVYLVNEAYTSKTCSVCGTTGKRTGNWFECKYCNYKDNADRNAAFNIG